MPTHVETAAAYAALQALADHPGGTWFDIGPHLTCSEADAMAAAFRVVDRENIAATLLEGHAFADEVGDAHYLQVGDLAAGPDFHGTIADMGEDDDGAEWLTVEGDPTRYAVEGVERVDP